MVRVLISMPDDFLGMIDDVASSEQRSRSELIREALRVYIHKTKARQNTQAVEKAALLEDLLD